MDDAFRSRVAERIAAATDAVSSFSPTADPGKLPAVQNMDEWMASHSPGAKLRCGDCKAPLVEGSTTICIACGRQLPPRLAMKRESFSFDKSLAQTLFYTSVHLEDPHDTSTDATDELQLQPTSSEVMANGYGKQRSPSAEEIEGGVQGDGRGKAIVSDASDNSVPAAPSSKSLKGEEDDEEYIWGSADADDLELRAWTQQLAPDSGADSKEFSSANNSAALHSGNSTIGQASSPNDDDIFAVASISADQSLSQYMETDFNFLLPSASNSIDQSGGEQANTAGPSSSKESFGPPLGTDFHDFFQSSPHTDLKMQTSEPNVPEESMSHNFDDFFQPPLKSTDQSHLHNVEIHTPISGEEPSKNNIEIDFDDFFQGVPKAADHSPGLNVQTPAPHAAEESRSHNVQADFNGFLQAAPESAGHSSGVNGKTSMPHTTEGSNDGEVEADFDDFLQAVPGTGHQFGGSNEETPIPHFVEDVSGQRGEEPYFDFFFQTPPQPANQPRGHSIEAGGPRFSEKASGQNVETDFDFFFRAGPVSSVDQSCDQNVEMGAPDLAKEPSEQKIEHHLDDFFQVSVKSAVQVHGQNAETMSPISAEGKSRQSLRTDFDIFQTVPESANHLGGLKVDAPVPQPAEGSTGEDGEADFDFFQAAPVLAGPSRGQNMNGTEPNSVERSAGQNIETDFDDFFRAAPKPANVSVGRSALSDFDFFFQTPKSEDGLHGRHIQPGVPDAVERSNGQVADRDFDEFFHAANNTISHSHGQKVTTLAPSPEKEHLEPMGETDFEYFFQAAPNPAGKSNGHDAAGNFDFFRPTPQGQNVPLKGQNLSMAFDGFFSTASHSVDKSFGKSETKGFDPFLQAVPLSMDNSLDQNAATDLDNGDFDDFVQAAPQSADKVLGPSPLTEFDSFFHAKSRSVDSSQESSITDFDDFFQAPPRTADKPPDVSTSTLFDFSNASHKVADKSHRKAVSMDYGRLFTSPRSEGPKHPSSPGFFVHGNGSGQTTQTGASPASTQSRSSNGDILTQLERLQISQSPLQGHLEPSRKTPNELSDLSFRLADHLIISDEAAPNMWSFN